MKCEAHIRVTRWHEYNNRHGCSFGATHLVYGIPMCSKHAAGRAGAVEMTNERFVQALREIAHGSSGRGAKADLAVIQTIARQTLGEQ